MNDFHSSIPDLNKAIASQNPFDRSLIVRSNDIWKPSFPDVPSINSVYMENQFIKYPDLADRTVVITGTNRGIGETLVKAFLSCQCRVVAVYRQDRPCISLPDIAEYRLILLQADIGDRTTIGAWLTEFESSGNWVNILVNNAGVLKNTPLLECDENDWHYIMDANLKHTFFLSQLFAKHMKKNDGKVRTNIGNSSTSPLKEDYNRYRF